MAFFSYDILHSKYAKIDSISYKLFHYINDCIRQITDENREYDIFLSYASKDKYIVKYLKYELEVMGHSVYVNQVDNRLTQEKKERLKYIIKQSKSMLFMTSEKYASTFDIPWEWHYFSSLGRKYLAILPVNTHIFSMYEMVTTWTKKGYYYISISKVSKQFANEIMIMNKESYMHMLECIDSMEMLFVHEDSFKFVLYDAWMQGEKPLSIREKLYQMIEYLDDCLK